MTSGGAGAWRSRGSRDAMPKPVSRTLPAASTSTLAGLMSLWMRPLPVDLAERRREEMARRRKRVSSSGRPSMPIERIAAGILEHEHRAAVVARKRERSRRPFRIEFVREGIFMLEPPEICRGLLGVQGRQHQDRVRVVRPPTSIEDVLATFP